ncbi:hypothetical protein ES705_26102 [subsurface metagenome]
MQKDLTKIMSGLDRIISGIKAKGGWKERKQFQMSDKELDLFLEKCEGRLRKMAVHLVVAETMLQEPAPSIHSRWEEYQMRRAECMAELGKR